VASDRRSQQQNRAAADERLSALVRHALHVPKKRRKTKPPAAAKRSGSRRRSCGRSGSGIAGWSWTRALKRQRRFRLWSAAAADGWLAARGGAHGLRLLGLRLPACGGAHGYRLLSIGCCHPERSEGPVSRSCN
jgi:hypothetical protein